MHGFEFMLCTYVSIMNDGGRNASNIKRGIFSF